MSPLLARRVPAEVRADPARVLARLFLPGEEPHDHRSRSAEIVGRVMALDEEEVERTVDSVLARFRPRHPRYEQTLLAHAVLVAPHVGAGIEPSPARMLLLGAAFTAEYAVEGAAVCNPSAVRHPDQTGLQDGQLRVAVSVRGIGEGHLSSIGFRCAVIGPGTQWEFRPPAPTINGGTVAPAPWRRDHLAAVLADHGDVDELAQAVLRELPDGSTEAEVDAVLMTTHPRLSSRPGALATTQLLRRVVSSAYRVCFAPDTLVEQRVLMPVAPEESNGMEDARFTRFTDADGTVEYRATYTAYDGRHIVPRLLTSPDLREFTATRLAGPAARNKGMALFPRQVGGRHLALCRSDGESTSVTSSSDGVVWTAPRRIHHPQLVWEALQVGNCGPPIETDAGWLVLTHGVGPMRTYTIGALLLDLDDPTIVRGRLNKPLLAPDATEQDGYVPNVVYSCGAVLHDGVLWIPYGIGDARIGVAAVGLDDLLRALGVVPTTVA